MHYTLKINEVATLYNLSTDALRYYEEIGLLNPQRGSNGYRYYSLADLWQLNVITDLRKLNVPFSVIKEYFQNRDLNKTKDLFQQQIKTIEEQILILQQLKDSMNYSLNTINRYQEPIDNSISIQHFPLRKCSKINDLQLSNKGIDMGFRILQSKSNDYIHLIGSNNMCVNIAIEKVLSKQLDHYRHLFDFDIQSHNIISPFEDLDFYQTVFCLLDDDVEEFDHTLEEGYYLTITYQGPHILSKKYTKELLDYAKEHNLRILSAPFEICFIDIHETSNQEEYITQLQMRIKKA